MLSIDEAIAHARAVANTQRGKSGICLQNGLECEHFSDCLKCAEEHEQLAEWLEELKCYKNDNDFSDYADRLHKIAFNSGYNKALDDFVNACKEDISCQTFGLHINGIERIAEQLKERD